MTINLSDEMVKTLKAALRDSNNVLQARQKRAAACHDKEMVSSAQDALNENQAALDMLNGVN